MTYMTIKMKIPGYMSRIYHGLFDTGANTSVCKKEVLPPELWKENGESILASFGAEKTITKYKAFNVKIMMSKEEFIIPSLHAYELDNVDIIIGSNFYNKYSPIIIDIPKRLIQFTKTDKKGNQTRYSNFLVKYPKEKILEPWIKGNSSLNQPLKNKENYEIKNINENTDLGEKINMILGDEIYGEDPLKNWEKHKTYAKIELKNEDDEIYKPPMIYKEEDYKEFDMHINEMTENGFIEEKKDFENKKYSSPTFIVMKHSEQKRGKSRMVVDYKELNRKAKIVKYPIPNMDILILRGIRANIFSKFDCKSGFYHIKLEEGSKKYTAFTVPQGYYQWRVLPFGYHNSPAIYQQFMDRIFRQYYEFILVYIDDILIFSKNEEEHMEHIKIFKQIILENGITLSKKKKEIAKTNIEFLGLEIEKGKIKLQPHIVDKILSKHVKVKNKTELQSILGLLNQIRSFIP